MSIIIWLSHLRHIHKMHKMLIILLFRLLKIMHTPSNPNSLLHPLLTIPPISVHPALQIMPTRHLSPPLQQLLPTLLAALHILLRPIQHKHMLILLHISI